MTERERMSSEQLIAGMYDLLIRQRVAQLREQDPRLTTEQAHAQAFREHPGAYEAQIALQRARQQGK